MKSKIGLFLFVLIAGLLSVPSAQAQYRKGDLLLNVGIGEGIHSHRVVPHVSFEYGFGKFFSAGVQTDIYTYRVWNDNRVYTSLPTSLRGSYHYGKHFLKNRSLDLYAGAAVGYQSIREHDYWHPRPHVGRYDEKLYVGLYAGAKYYVRPQFGFFAEVGHNISWLKAGVAWKF
jgi:hypothetical protein